MYTLRKSQSLKSLTENPEGSWVRPSNALSRGRKSVLQLVQQYQSIGDLRISEKPQVQFDTLDGRWGYGRSSFPLSRSRSMELLSRGGGDQVGTSALRDLFESKSTLCMDYGSSPSLCPLVAERGHSSTPAKNTGPQKVAQDGNSPRDTLKRVFPEASLRASPGPPRGAFVLTFVNFVQQFVSLAHRPSLAVRLGAWS
ncbi:hypothetical protein CRUP_037028 [Coryphaenoides rupestris]|nr:hypothetical protein CRUP_037028 [Coryphaenoides rupestris]